MSIPEIIGSVLIVIGVLIAAIAMVGLIRFNDVLSRMHAASKPQTLGLVLVLAGAAIASESLPLAGMLALVLAAQFLTMTASSAMLGRAAFRRGFLLGSDYAFDELTPRLSIGGEGDDDDDGFIDPEAEAHPDVESEDALPTNVLTHTTGLELAELKQHFDDGGIDENAEGTGAAGQASDTPGRAGVPSDGEETEVGEPGPGGPGAEEAGGR